jgi:hypothetical protein
MIGPAAIVSHSLIPAATKQKTSYMEILSTWGFSYLPTMLFLTFLLATHVIFKNFILARSSLVTILTMSFMIMLFLWKLVFYFIELRAVLNEGLTGIVISSVILGVLFIIYYFICAFTFGFKVPIV